MSTLIKTSPYGSGDGLLIEPVAGGSLADIDPVELRGLLAGAGYLLLRGFEGTDMTVFTALVQGTSVRTTLDPAREFYSDVAQKVDAGYDPVGLHTENGNSPFRSHLAWFFSEKAASSGSQTTVCDGYRVWEALSATTREAFAAQEIVYSRYVGRQQWQTMAYHLLDKAKPAEEITVEDLQQLAALVPGTQVIAQPDGGIVYAFQTPAAAGTVFGTRTAFANSILGPSNNYEKPRITFADGTDIPPPMLEEVARVTAAYTEDLNWQDGDVAVIDNTRVMHGRRAITDPNRTIYNALSYVEVKALAAAA